MILVANGKFTSYMTAQNNLLICKKFDGKKLDKAIEWGINVVNHLWLQDIWFDRPVKEISDRRYTVCDKDTVDLDYTLAKNLMVGWRTSLKLNEQDAKRLSEFKEASLSAKKKANSIDTGSVLVSKENIIQDGAASANPKKSITDKNSSNLGSNPLNEPSQCPPNSTSTTISSFTTTPASSISAISNQTDTLTTVAAPTCGNQAPDQSSIISPFTAANSSTIKAENTVTNPSPNQPNSSSTSTTTDQKLIDEASIKKEKSDDESVNTFKVPTSDERTKETGATDSHLMEVDAVDGVLPKATTTGPTVQPITQTAGDKSSSIEMKPTNEENNKTDHSLKSASNVQLNNSMSEIKVEPVMPSNATGCLAQKPADSTILFSATTVSPAILTVAPAMITSQATGGNNASDSKELSTIMVNGDCNPNKSIEMMEVDEPEKSKEVSLIQNHKSPKSREKDALDDQPPVKRLKAELSEESKMDVQSDSIVSKNEPQPGDAASATKPPVGPTTNGLHGSEKDGEENNDSSNVQLEKTGAQAKTGVEQNPNKSRWSPETIKVCITNSPNAKELSDIVLSLGGKMAVDPVGCTHLVSSKVERTIKFVCAFSHARFVLDPDWLIKSKASGCFLKERDYFLSDPANEEQFGMTIRESFERRQLRENKPLFKDMMFFITRSCVPSFKLLVQIIRSAGGTAVVKHPPTAQGLEVLKNQKKVTFVVISCENDLHLCDLFYEKDIRKFASSSFLKRTFVRPP